MTFHLEDFDGPLELLLALVAKHKMNLHNIPILQLIDQYTRTVEQADPNPETASAFIEMAAHLVEMKSFLLLPRSEEGERMKQELTGQLIEYDQCRRMAALLRAKGEAAPVFVRRPMEMELDNTYALHHAPQMLADYWQALAGRTKTRRVPTQQQLSRWSPRLWCRSPAGWCISCAGCWAAQWQKWSSCFPAARAAAPT